MEPIGNIGVENAYEVFAPVADLRGEPNKYGSLESQALIGERVTVTAYDAKWNGWARARTERYRNENYIRIDALGDAGRVPRTYRVAVPTAILCRRPRFKEAAVEQLPLNGRVALDQWQDTPEGEMVRVDGRGWGFRDQFVPVDERPRDFVLEAERLLGAPYLWGGMTYAGGLDCSAVVLNACLAAGIDCERDCVPQSKTLGEAIDFDPGAPDLRRGDLPFWTGGKKGRHVGIMLNGTDLLHATIAPGIRRVVVQPLAQVIADQSRDENGPITVVRRIPGYGS